MKGVGLRDERCRFTGKGVGLREKGKGDRLWEKVKVIVYGVKGKGVGLRDER